MKKLTSILSVIFAITITACQSDDTTAAINLENSLRLSEVIANRTIETGAVIACAASDRNGSSVVHVFYYLEAGATNVQFFETNTTAVDQNDYSNYRKLDLPSQALFEGFIYQFTRPFGHDQWVIVTFELDGEIKISNPIHIKNNSKPTVWTDEVAIDQQVSKMPKFSWEHNANGDNAIYFQIVSTVDDGLLSGTYTLENQFQYYNTSNVILNISVENPLELTIDNSYKFTLMDVSADNWVNTVIQSIFIAQ
jgi:hypothetical protein